MSFQIGLEIGVTVFVVLLQVYFFNSSMAKIRDLEALFPDYEFDNQYIEHSEGDEVPLLTDAEKTFSDDFIAMARTINKYLVNNHGNTDFASVKSIVERKIENKENVINAGISVPLYIGLLGTFLGVCIGLVKIAFFGGVTDENISAFIGGIFIAMIGSFFGLLFTVINNAHNFKRAKTLCDSRKNDFFNFLETDLFPHVGSGLFHALELLKTNIQEFNRTFKSNIDLFDTKFADNIKSLVLSVESISENIDDVIENTKSQQEFLAELRNIGHLQMAETNLRAFTMLNKATPSLLEFIEKQKDLTAAVAHASEFVSLIESILNRFKSFEAGLNRLGDTINTREYLGSEILIRIDNNLTHLDKQFELLKRHESDTSISLEAHFKNQYQQVQRLTNDIKGEVEHALELRIDNNPLHKLQLLESIDKSLELIKKSLEKRQEEENSNRDNNRRETGILPTPPSPQPPIHQISTNGGNFEKLHEQKKPADEPVVHEGVAAEEPENVHRDTENIRLEEGQSSIVPVVEGPSPVPPVRPEPPPMPPAPRPSHEEPGRFSKLWKNVFGK